MTNIQVGPLVLNTELLVYVAAGLFSIGSVWFNRKGHSHREVDVSDAWIMVWIWLAVWKGSLLLIDPSSVLDHPMSMIYFSGGVLGMWLATIIALSVGWFRARKRYAARERTELLVVAVAGWLVVYAIVVISMADQVSFVQSAILVFSMGIWLVLQISRRMTIRVPGARGRHLLQGAAGVLILLLLSYTLYDGLNRTTDVNADGDRVVGIREGNLSPSVSLVDVTGNEVTLEQFRGKTVMINFWTTWCTVCKTEMPHVEKLYQQYSADTDDVTVLSINVTSQDGSAQHVKDYVEKQDFQFPIALDLRGEAMNQFRIGAYPTTFIIDREGIVRDRFVGAISYGDMKKRIERVRHS